MGTDKLYLELSDSKNLPTMNVLYLLNYRNHKLYLKVNKCPIRRIYPP